ncbi:MAG: DNA processing protein DprA [candidate division WS2 bacterium]|nr:DNA processing protein DprA [Candidatus Psychracetigena formicireducens]
MKLENFPRVLRETPDPPPRLFVMGSLPQDEELTIAIVGTRKATDAGLKSAERFAKELNRQGAVIISGLAMGIDAAAHEGTLQNQGKTVAVLGNGLPKIYPAQNENLAKKILEAGGAIASEYKENHPSYKGNFIQRNRIISGLALAVIVIEAPLRSGALATATFAATQGREVFVVPGPINHPNYIGSHALIRDGARLVTSPEEVIEDLGLDRLPTMRESTKRDSSVKLKLTTEEELVFMKVKVQNFPLPVDKIVELTKLDPQIVNSSLASLIIKGFIQEAGGGYTI